MWGIATLLASGMAAVVLARRPFATLLVYTVTLGVTALSFLAAIGTLLGRPLVIGIMQ